MSEYEESEEVMDIWHRLGIKVTNPLKFVADLSRAQQLEIQRQHDPQDSMPLIQVYERLLGQAETEKNPALCATICNNLGTVYRDLPTGDREANLREAIRCHREALRFWTAESAPAQYSVAQRNLGIDYSSLSIGDREANLREAITCYREALRFNTPENAPADFARVQFNLGTAYHELPTGDRAVNLQEAIACYQEALRVWTAENAPADYATVQNNLGETYRNLPTGDPTDNLQKAIACYRDALRFWTAESAPADYAKIQNNLGIAYSDLPTDNHMANLREAITCYREALRVWTAESAPTDYASTQSNLGNAYRDLPIGDRGANLQEAIRCYREALRIWTMESAPTDYANTQTSLGNVYSDLPTGDRETNLQMAIACFKEALRFWTAESAPADYALVQNNLSNVYSKLPIGDRTGNLQQAIAYAQEALRVWTVESAPADYAIAQTSLGNAYFSLPTGDRETNLQMAIACFKEALRFKTAESALTDYAKVQNNLGSAYSDLPAGNRAANLHMAIACFKEALRFWTVESAPADYALVQNNLGVAYRNLPTGDRTGNLQQAMVCFRVALHFRTAESTPLEYATTEANLGNVYRDLLTGDRVDNLQKAITCYQEALRFWTPESAPDNYCTAQNSMGLIYSDLPTGDRAANLQKAIAYYQEALRFWTAESAPTQYAKVQSNLGNVYSNSPTGDRATNLQQAIAYYQEALRFYTPETAPFYYATVQTCLGTAYRNLPTEDRTGNLQQAIVCYQEALRFWTAESAPFDCRRANSNLADLYFTAKEWQAALSTYRAAMDAGERLYRAGLSSESKATEMAANTTLYRNAAFTAVRCGQVAEALLILEQGKTRLLTEALRLHVVRPDNVPDEMWMEFEKAGEAVRVAQAGNPDMFSQEHDPLQTYAAREQAARDANAALETAIEHVRTSAPEFLHSIDLPTIQRFLPDEHTVLVTLCITVQGSMGFVVGQNHDPYIHMVELPTFTKVDLDRLFVEQDTDGKVISGWLVAYGLSLAEHSSTSIVTWQEMITRTLAVLGQDLLAPILSVLPAHVERIIIFPSAELFLLPLHAAPLSDKDAGRVCDRYQVSYAPSMEVLANTRARVMQVTPDLYAVINPQADAQLVYTSSEGAAIASLFAQHEVDEGRVGTKEHVIARATGRSYLHFSCHGSYNWNDPARSGLALADDQLTLADLQQGTIDLSTARLVTLSACETGMVDVFRGSAEEYVGIPAGFLLAGVPCVVSSLWSVPDLSTALLMEQLYSNHLSRGMDIAAALREAQLWIRDLSVGEVAEYAEQCCQHARREEQMALYRLMRFYRAQAKQNSTSRPFAHPYYWAAFTVNGL